MLGTGELRIDEPLPPKADAPAPAAAHAGGRAAAEKPPEKRLTRLEQLRLDREKEKAAAKAQAAGAVEPRPLSPQPLLRASSTAEPAAAR